MTTEFKPCICPVIIQFGAADTDTNDNHNLILSILNNQDNRCCKLEYVITNEAAKNKYILCCGNYEYPS